jgi:hypothetical protein
VIWRSFSEKAELCSVKPHSNYGKLSPCKETPESSCSISREGGGGGKFIEATRHAGGPKHIECRVYLSAFNHADTEVILRAVDQAPWRDREMVQVFVKEQEEEVFLLRYSGGSTQKRPSR